MLPVRELQIIVSSDASIEVEEDIQQIKLTYFHTHLMNTPTSCSSHIQYIRLTLTSIEKRRKTRNNMKLIARTYINQHQHLTTIFPMLRPL